MKTFFKSLLGVLVLFAVCLVFFQMLRSEEVVVLDPKGIIGQKQKDLLIFSTWVMSLVVVPAILMTLGFAWKYREGKGSVFRPNWSHSYIAELLWWGIPCIIIVVLSIVTWRSTHELSPYRPIASKNREQIVQVVALNWKWLFLYPEEGIACVNWVEFPVKHPVRFEITSDAPMNSFWIPQLGGQIYAMAAMKTELNLMADEIGHYRGLSSHISGEGFAGMRFTAFATSEAEYASWVQQVRESSEVLTYERYQELKKPSKYDSPQFFVLQDQALFDKIIQNYLKR